MAELKNEYLNDIQGWTDKIITDSKSYMIYREDKEETRNFLKQLEKDHPVVPSSSCAAGVYIDNFGIAKPEQDSQFFSSFTNTLADKLSVDYAHCAILQRVCERVEDLDDKRVSQIVMECIRETKRICPDAKELGDYIAGMRSLLPEIANEYTSLASGAEKIENKHAFSFELFSLKSTLREIMKQIDNKSHFSLILDKRGPLATGSMRDINDLIASGIPIKLMLEPELDAWDTMHNDGTHLAAFDFEPLALDAKGRELLLRKYGTTGIF